VLPDFTPGELTFKPVPMFTYANSLADETASGRITRPDAINMLDAMLSVRFFEEMIVTLKKGKFEPLARFKFIGATHLSMGQEAVAVGTMSAIRHDDYITSTHRGHGHSIAKGYYALLTADDDYLCEFVGPTADRAKSGLLDCAIQEHINRTMAELFGKQLGYCHGRGGGMHIADFHAGHLGANAIVGGSYAIAAGAAMACDKLQNGRVVACLVGDGATNNGIAHEAYNFACMTQFKRGCPVIFIIENNQYGMTGQQVGEVTGIDHLARRGAAYNFDNMHAEVVNGMDVLAVHDAVSRAADLCRNGQGPVLLECLTYRYMGHSLSDDRMSYRTEEEEAAWQAQDPIRRFQRQVVDSGVMTGEQVNARREQARERVDFATVFAAKCEDPDPKDIYDGLYTDTDSEGIGDEYKTPASEILQEPVKVRRDNQGRVLFRHAVCEALIEEMMRDKRVILYGEDVADYGGAFGVTKGIIDIFGRDRCFNTAISESAIIGTGAGAAMVGMRPVVELMYIDFILMTMDQTGNQVAKARYMFGGKATVPMVIRTTVGGGKGYAGQHSQSLEAVATMFPGLRVIAPATAYDAKGLLKSAIRDDNPVVFIEHQLSYLEKGECPEDDYTIPIGVAKVAREGTDVTVVAYSYMYHVAMEAAELAAAEGISVEVVDPRTLMPLDTETIAASVKKTGHLVIVQQAPEQGCFGEHIAYQLQSCCFASLKAPVKIVAAHNVPPPMAEPLEKENIPSPEKVLANVKATLNAER
jgi:2-oxoisovalerate dehydrogenase E1 component